MSISSELKTSDKFHARDVLKDKSKWRLSLTILDMFSICSMSHEIAIWIDVSGVILRLWFLSLISLKKEKTLDSCSWILIQHSFDVLFLYCLILWTLLISRRHDFRAWKDCCASKEGRKKTSTWKEGEA
jgi:hypothetical protein